MDMVEEGLALCFRGDAFKRIISAPICVFLQKHIVCMVVDDWEALDQQFEVFCGRVIKICDLVYW